jgi:hypothetical protein
MQEAPSTSKKRRSKKNAKPAVEDVEMMEDD